jgi:protein-disulfide isomerase
MGENEKPPGVGPDEPPEPGESVERTPAEGSAEREVTEPVGKAGPGETLEAQGTEAAPDAQPAEEATTPQRTGPPQDYLTTAAISATVLVFGLALFVAGIWTHSLTDDPIELAPIQDELVTLNERLIELAPIEQQLITLNARMGEIQDTLSQGVAGDGDGAGDGGTSPAAATSAASDDDPSLGPEDAGVVIVEFSDFQCPYCAKFAVETFPGIRDTYGDQVRFIFRDFPLNVIHPAAQKAAEAAQCAQDQGSFWEYHDLLFANQNALALPDLKSYAAQIGLDTGQFDECLDSGKNAQEVALDMQDGHTAGVTGTPAFIVNGQLVSGAQPIEVFRAVIDQALAAAGE